MRDRHPREQRQLPKNKPIKKPQQRSGRYQNPQQNRKRLFHQIKQIDRTQTCPFLVRIFYAINDQNHYNQKTSTELPKDKQVRLHLWMNSTLKQISELLRAMMPQVRTKQKFHFWKLTWNKDKKSYEKDQLGWVYVSRRYDKVQEKALCHTKFNIGDMIDVSITYK